MLIESRLFLNLDLSHLNFCVDSFPNQIPGVCKQNFMIYHLKYAYSFVDYCIHRAFNREDWKMVAKYFLFHSFVCWTSFFPWIYWIHIVLFLVVFMFVCLFPLMGFKRNRECSIGFRLLQCIFLLVVFVAPIVAWL